MSRKKPIRPQAFRLTINDGIADQQIFAGYLQASDLDVLAAVSSFSKDVKQHEIAERVLTPPLTR
jgi:hypothetical protein